MLLLSILLFVLGTILASFAGVLIERGRGGFDIAQLPKMLGGRSYCPGCKQAKKKTTRLVRRQLIPLVGRLAQGGRCTRCEQAIPRWYPLFEVAMGVAFVATARAIPGLSWESILTGGPTLYALAFWLPIVWGSVSIIVADLLRYELNVWLWLFLLVRIGGWGLVGYFPIGEGAVWMLILLAVFVGIYRFGKRYVQTIFDQEGEGFGQGDVFMSVLVGLLFPFVTQGAHWIDKVQLLLIYLVVSSLVGMLFRALRWAITHDKDGMMPFLPAMIMGFVIVLVWGELIVSWL